MKHYHYSMPLIFTIVIGGNVFAQHNIGFAGTSSTSPTGSFSYTCGEVAVQTAKVSSITVVDATQFFSEGVQQGYTTRELDIDEILNVNISVYPNPTTGIVIVENTDGISNLNYELYNLDGKLLAQGSCTEITTKLDLTKKSIGSYLLRISCSENGKKRIYKIIKN